MICRHCEREIESGYIRYEHSVKGTRIMKVTSKQYELVKEYREVIDPEPYCEECHNEIMGYNKRRA